MKRSMMAGDAMSDESRTLDTTNTDLEISNDLQWLAREYPNRSKVEHPNPGSPMYQRFDAVREKLQRWLDATWSGDYTIERAFHTHDERWVDMPSLVIRSTSESANLRWPVLRLWIGLLPGPAKMLLALVDYREHLAGFEGNTEAPLLVSQRRDLRDWMLSGEETAEWDEDVGEDVETEMDLPYQWLTSKSVMGRILDLDWATDEALSQQLRIACERWQSYGHAVRNQSIEEILSGGREWEPSLGAEASSELPRLPEGYVAPTAVNTILYGPPGTGKTYSTARRALELCQPEGGWKDMPYDAVMAEYRRMHEAGRIDVVTFHQSYGYEEFVEGIRPVLQSVDEEAETTVGGDVRYRCEYGVFKRMALLAASAGLTLTADDQQFEARWRALLQKIEEAGDYRTQSSSGYQYFMRTAPDNQILIQRIGGDRPDPTTYTVKTSSARVWWEHRDKLGQNFGAIKQQHLREVLPKSGDYTPNWIVYKELCELGRHEINEVGSTADAPTLDRDERIRMAREYLTQGSTARFNRFGEAEHYVLIIDEINRGNMSKILGELITLLEPSKRLTCEQEMVVTLPYSKERFGVPPNLHVIGTMNTADRSIALMDVALRRRFHFEEMMPDVGVIIDVLSRKLGGVPYEELSDKSQIQHVNLVAALFETINERLRFLYDPDHQIGHSYFLDALDVESLRMTFTRNVIPLLQEYFYNSWDRICLVLGCPYDEEGNLARSMSKSRPIVHATKRLEASVLLLDHDNYEDLIDYRVDSEFNRSIRTSNLMEFFTGILAPHVVDTVNDGSYITELLRGRIA
ncbi:MAG: McrB family protein [Bradymonadaceae bacterium]